MRVFTSTSENGIQQSPTNKGALFEFEIYANFLPNEIGMKGVSQFLIQRKILSSRIQLVLVHNMLLINSQETSA